MTAIRTLIVDDEAPARQWLRSLCNKHTQIQVVGECSTAAGAAQKLRTLPVDLLLLDIQLGPHTGFQVLEEVPPLSTPLVVIVSAFDQYAVTAYEKNAIDYLLKPVLEERFRASVERVQRQLRGGLTNEIRAQIAASIGALHQALLESRPPALSARLAPPSRIIRAKDSPARGVRASCCRRAILPVRPESHS